MKNTNEKILKSIASRISKIAKKSKLNIVDSSLEVSGYDCNPLDVNEVTVKVEGELFSRETYALGKCRVIINYNVGAIDKNLTSEQIDEQYMNPIVAALSGKSNFTSCVLKRDKNNNGKFIIKFKVDVRIDVIPSSIATLSYALGSLKDPKILDNENEFNVLKSYVKYFTILTFNKYNGGVLYAINNDLIKQYKNDLANAIKNIDKSGKNELPNEFYTTIKEVSNINENDFNVYSVSICAGEFKFDLLESLLENVKNITELEHVNIDIIEIFKY